MKEKKPIIFAVDDDQQVLNSLVRDLKSNYRKNYRILGTISAEEALSTLKELDKKDEAVALLLSDQRMPEMGGVDYLEQARQHFPDARRVLITAYSDTDAAIKAINDVQLDYYLLKPWDPPEDKLFPVLDDLLDEWHRAYRPAYRGLRVIGYQYSPQSHELKDFLSGNLFPYKWIDVQQDQEAKKVLQKFELQETQLPAVIMEGGKVYAQPSAREIALALGLNPNPPSDIYDVVIIGAGPAGLGAAVYGGSEGLKTLLIEKRAPGGQAGTSSRIENYLGFPKGLSGSELARRAVTQANRFGIDMLVPQEVSKVEIQDPYKHITLKDGTELNTKGIIISVGVDYRKLEAKNIDNFTGAGVYYGAATTEARSTRDQDVYIVGGGNSAGQGAMHLSRFAKNVYIVIRGETLKGSMSSYLIKQIEDTDNIHLITDTEVTEVMGDDRLKQVVLENRDRTEKQVCEACALFVFIGARPFTDWLDGTVLRNERGFVATGRDLRNFDEFGKIWKKDREPFLLETSHSGIFAAGDVRMNSMARVASAVGEGAMAISFMHRYLREI